jgi:hypothetical protein
LGAHLVRDVGKEKKTKTNFIALAKERKNFSFLSSHSQKKVEKTFTEVLFIFTRHSSLINFRYNSFPFP